MHKLKKIYNSKSKVKKLLLSAVAAGAAFMLTACGAGNVAGNVVGDSAENPAASSAETSGNQSAQAGDKQDRKSVV